MQIVITQMIITQMIVQTIHHFIHLLQSACHDSSSDLIRSQ